MRNVKPAATANAGEQSVSGTPSIVKRSFFTPDESKSLFFGLNRCPKDPL